jgi:catalase
VKFHFKTLQGIKNFTHAEALGIRGQDPDWAQRDLVEAIDRGDYPQWALKIQVMTDHLTSQRFGRTVSSRSSTWAS